MTDATDLTLAEDWNTTPAIARNKLTALKDACLKLPQAEVPMLEYLSDGCYAREILIPKGVCAVGAIHAEPWIIIISRGKVRVASEDGTYIIDATEKPVTFISTVGKQYAAHALEDTWWTCFRAVGDLTKTEDIRAKYIVDDYTALEDKDGMGSNSSNSSDSDRLLSV